MGKFKELPPNVLGAIAGKVGKKLLWGDKSVLKTPPLPQVDALGASPGLAGGATFHETMDVWILEASMILEPSDNLATLARPTGRWHHQIAFSNKIIGFARTKPLGPLPDDWSVIGIFYSQLAEKIDDAVKWIDNSILDNDKHVVRLLNVPAYQVVSFWLIGDDSQSVVIIETSPFTNLKLERLYTSKEFLDILRSIPQVEGILE